MILPIALVMVGLVCSYLGLLEIRDMRGSQGQFSKRHRVSFSRGKIMRSLVAFDSWIRLASLIGLGALSATIGIWLLVK
ncbi:MAG TPA: hypothetical protein VIC34_08365 [Croceibacterium sp.]